MKAINFINIPFTNCDKKITEMTMFKFWFKMYF